MATEGKVGRKIDGWRRKDRSEEMTVDKELLRGLMCLSFKMKAGDRFLM